MMKNILMVTDLSARSDRALEIAIDVAPQTRRGHVGYSRHR